MSDLPKHDQVLLALWRACEDAYDGWALRDDLARELGWHPLDVENELGGLAELGLITGFWDSAHPVPQDTLYCLKAAGLIRARELTAAAVRSAAPEVRVQPPRLPTRPADRKRWDVIADIIRPSVSDGITDFATLDAEVQHHYKGKPPGESQLRAIIAAVADGNL